MLKDLKVGMIGLDTSHVVAFAELLNNPHNEYHVAGGRVSIAFPGGSHDMEISSSRIHDYTETLSADFGVEIVGSPEKVAEQCDAILLTSVDGRVHLEQFERIAGFGLPTFVDKPLATNSEEARAVFDLADRRKIPFMSCSALRYAEGLTQILNRMDGSEIFGVDCFGPLPIQPTQPGLFWYGIHAAEMLFTALGRGCHQVIVIANPDHEVVVGSWEDGRIGTLRGNRVGGGSFGALIHQADSTRFVDVHAHPKPYYSSLLECIMTMFHTGKPTVDAQETLEIISFIEAANESRKTGRSVHL